MTKFFKNKFFWTIHNKLWETNLFLCFLSCFKTDMIMSGCRMRVDKCSALNWLFLREDSVSIVTNDQWWSNQVIFHVILSRKTIPCLGILTCEHTTNVITRRQTQQLDINNFVRWTTRLNNDSKQLMVSKHNTSQTAAVDQLLEDVFMLD